MKKIIYWFRNDLRLHDQPILKQFEKSNDIELIPAFCFDERWFTEHKLGFKKTGIIRTKFLIETVNNLKAYLNGIGSDLLLLHGKTEEVISGLAIILSADEIYAEKEDTHEEIIIEQEIRKRISVPLILHESKTLLRTVQLSFSINDLPDVFTGFRKNIETLLDQVEIYDEIIRLPTFPDEFRDDKIFTLNDFGLLEVEEDQRSVLKFIGGEGKGLERLEKFVWEDKNIVHYKETRNELVGEGYSSKFSPWLANGSLSSRKIFYEVKKFEKEVNANISTYWLVFELLWRDYFRFVAKKYGNKIFLKGGIKNRAQNFVNDFSLFEKWQTGNTGNDFVDANMIELLKTGFMSNRGRQNVASYLCKDLKIDWRWGAAWFESQLIDYDVASNWGNWMYVAGVGNDPRPNRYFNVNKQADRYDADRKYRKLWLNK
jgi:deoxyribodipyrimidine photo-lyase